MNEIYLEGGGSIPVIYNVDVLIIGTGLAGVSSAEAFSAAGKKVLLVGKETFLGYEIGLWQRPWLTWKENKKNLILDWFPVAIVPRKIKEGSLIPLHMDKLKLKLEEKMLKTGVELLYASHVKECYWEGESWRIIVGNKAGRQAVKAKYVIDNTENGILSILSEGFAGLQNSAVSNIKSEEKLIRVRRTLEFTNVDAIEYEFLEIPERYGICNNKLDIYPGACSKDHVIIDIPIEISSDSFGNMKEDVYKLSNTIVHAFEQN